MNLTRALQRALVPPSARSDGLRAPVVGTSTVGRFSGISGTMISEWDAETAIRQAYLVNWVVYRCAVINAEKIASLPIRVGKDPNRPEQFDVEAPLARLLSPAPRGPNPDTSPEELLAHSVASYQVTGRFGWEVEWSGKPGKSDVVALWPLIAQYLQPQPRSERESANQVNSPRYFNAFEYTSNVDRKTLSWQQCFYVWKQSLHDWRQPESALQAARLDVASMVEQSIYDYAFLKHDAVPASLVVTQAFESKEAFEAFKSQWLAKYGGSANAGKTGFVEMDAEDGNVGQMVDVKILGQSQKDSLADVRYAQKAEAICGAMGVPKSKLDASNRTFSNAEAEDLTWEHDTIIPMAKRLQAAINIRLAPFLGSEVCWFDLSSLKSQQTKTSWLPVSPLDAHAAGVMSVNATRLALGQPPVKDPKADEVPSLSKSAATPAVKSEVPPASLSQKTAPVRSILPSGIMVAFMLDQPTAAKLAVEGGLPPSELHCTLAYLGKNTDVIDREVLETAVRQFAAAQHPLAGKVTGHGVLNAGTDGWAVTALVDAPGLDELRHGLVVVLEEAGIPVANGHSFLPHITVAYTEDRQSAQEIEVAADVPLSWSTITIAWGATKIVCPMTARRTSWIGGKRVYSPLSHWADGADSWPEAGHRLPALSDPSVSEEQQRYEKLWRSFDAQASALEATWERSFRSLFARQSEATLARLNGRRGKQLLTRALEGATLPDPSEIFDTGFWNPETAYQATGLYESVATVVATRLIDQLPTDIPATAEFVKQFVSDRANTLADQVTQTTYEQIKAALVDGIAEGEGIPKIANRVKAVFEEASTNRATLIARTEVVSSYNGTTDLFGRNLADDIVAGKEWIATVDSRTRSSHRDANGQAVESTESFSVGGWSMAYPGDPAAPADEICNCRCTLALLTPEEMTTHRSAVQYQRVEEVEAELIRTAELLASC